MSDSYQAVYDAARSRIGGCNTSDAIGSAAREAFDLGHTRDILTQEITCVSHEMQRPSVLFRPTISLDGNAWIALYGSDLATGVVGCGDSPNAAMEAFDKAWNTKMPPVKQK